MNKKNLFTMCCVLCIIMLAFCGCDALLNKPSTSPSTTPSTTPSVLPSLSPTPTACVHSFSDVVDDEYLVSSATCETPTTYFKSCSFCGEVGEDTFVVGDPLPHEYDQQNSAYAYLVTEWSDGASAVYNYSCECGAKGTQTFELSASANETTHAPVALNMCIYDSNSLAYGFNWVTRAQMYTPVIMVKRAEADEWSYYGAKVREGISMSEYEGSESATEMPIYTYKVDFSLEENTDYVYQIKDLATGYTSDLKSMTTVQLDKESFSFVNITDTQDAEAFKYGQLSYDNAELGDFILHTGDMVESGKYLTQWQGSIDGQDGARRQYFDKLPLMALPGNHDTTYKSNKGDFANFLNNNIPEQNTDYGYYYSFEYGNAKFIMLNTNLGTQWGSIALGKEQLIWLERELATNTKDWLFVAMHHPVWSLRNYTGPNGSSDDYYSQYRDMREQVSDMFAQYGVDVVFQGHGHRVEKTFAIGENYQKMPETYETIDGISYSVDPNGVIYCQNGTSAYQAYGAPVLGTSDNPTKHYDENPHSYLYDIDNFAETQVKCVWAEVDVDGGLLTVVVKYYDVHTDTIKTISQWGIKKTID